MRGGWFTILIGMFACGFANGQEFARLYDPPSTTVQTTPPHSPPYQGEEGGGSAEIQELKATVERLRQRLDQLGPVTDESSAKRLEAFWDNGAYLKSSNGLFQAHLGGNFQFDNGWSAVSQNVQNGPGGIGPLDDGGLFRRARIRTDGTLFRYFEWLTEFDFANSVENDNGVGRQTIGTPSFINVWLGVNQLPWIGSLRAGWIGEPLGMENNTSNRWLSFMERMPGNPSFTSPGILLVNYSADERFTWGAGAFHVQDNNFGFGFGDGQYAYTGRLTWLPWYEYDGEQLLHLGIGVSHRHLNDNEVELRARPSVRTMPSTELPALADTGTIEGSNEDILNLEFAGVYGSWTIQSEYFGRWIHDTTYPATAAGVPLGTLFYQGAYVQVLYFLTGEHQPYNRKEGTFTRVAPNSDFNCWDCPHGWGAWQIGFRYAYVDFQNKGVNGATLNDITLGVNWFLNSQAKIQWNFATDHRDSTPSGSNGWTYIFGIRLALDF